MGLSPNLDAALEYLERTPLDQLEDGVYPILGEDVWVRISHITTKPLSQAKPESHRDFADIQMVLEGEETIRCAFLDQMIGRTEDYPHRDIAFYEGPGQDLTLTPGQFLILFPDDVHAPALSPRAPSFVRKALFKVRLGQP